MQMATDLRQAGDGVQKRVVHVPRMRAGKANPLDTVDSLHSLEQPGKTARRIVGRLVMVDDLSQQLDFLPACRRGVANFGHDVCLAPHAFMAARVRHHAEAAEFVAALDDGDVRLDWIASSRHAERPADIIVGIQIDDGP